MSGWLDSLPHQIPFRAASTGRAVGERTIEGKMVVTASDALAEGGSLPLALVFEAMAQVAGGLAFPEGGRPGYFSAVDSSSMEAIPEPGDVIALIVRQEASFGRVFRFQGVATRDGLEIARARFYLAAADEPAV